MTTIEEALRQLIDRAAADPDFKARLAADPLGVARDEGYALSVDDLKNFLGKAEASDEEIVEELKGRVSHSTISVFELNIDVREMTS